MNHRTRNTSPDTALASDATTDPSEPLPTLVRVDPAVSVQQAQIILASEERFAIEPIVIHGRPMGAWATGPKHIRDIYALGASQPDSIFLVYERDRVSFGAFRKAVAHLANKLVETGLQPADRVALLMRNRTEWPVAFFAIMLAGGIAVPINGWDQEASIALMIADSGARFLIGDRVDRSILPESVEHAWLIEGPGQSLSELLPDVDEWANLPDEGLPPIDPDPDAIGAIFYTSGTTGRPKGATLTHRAMAAAVRNSEYQRARFALRYPELVTAPRAELAALFPVPMFHVTGAVAGLLVAAANGAKLVLMRKWDPEHALELVERERITLIGGVPTLPLQMLSSPSIGKYDLSSLSDFLYGGAPAPSDLPRAISSRFQARSATGWGMTETAATFIQNSGADYLDRPRSCGLVAAVNAVRVVDDAGNVLGPDIPGELQVRGLTVTHGYWNQPDATTQAFDADHWLKTGDYATIDAEGFVTVVDRIKDVIFRGGENLFTAEIEDAVAAHPDVIEASVLGRPHPTLGEEPVAFVVLGDPQAADIDGLLEFVRKKLPRQKVPVAVVVVPDALPRNATGKVIKANLKGMLPG